MAPSSSASPEPLGRHAVVVGAGMAGLAAAGALAPHFKRVTVLERDGLGDRPAHRPGTPQSRQLHGLLPGGLEALCAIFPGLDRDLAAAGAAPIRVGADVREELPGFDPFPRRDFGWMVYAASRPLIEHTVRQHLRALPRVALRDRARVLDLVPSPDGSTIVGVRCAGIGGTPG
jgi:2-polyprenyl-6-methoxyphenol hydroxylase-like FAD-dependent oxidoreductase